MLGVFFATSVNLTSQSLSSTLHACPLEKKRRTGFSSMPADNRFCSSCPFAQTAGYSVYSPCPYFALWCSSAVPKRPILSYCYRRVLAVYWESEKVELKFLSVGTKTYEPYYALCYSDRGHSCKVLQVCKSNLVAVLHEQRQLELLWICYGVNGTWMCPTSYPILKSMY